MTRKTEPTARIKMLCNRGEYENGREYDVPIAVANELTGYGMATLIAHENAASAAEGE